MSDDSGVRFSSSAHEAAYARVREILERLFPGQVEVVRSVPVFEVRLAAQNGSARTFVSILPTDEHILVRTTAWVLRNVAPSFELYKHLLLRSASTRFGAYFLNEDGDVGFSHTIVGETLDDDELRTSVVSVASTADTDDDDLRDRFGGIRAIDDVPVS